MKASNKHNILFGMLVVSLGLTKSWTGATTNMGAATLASTTTAQTSEICQNSGKTINCKIKGVSDGESYEIDATVAERKTQDYQVENGKLKQGAEKTSTVATFSINGCTSCISDLTLENSANGIVAILVDYAKKQAPDAIKNNKKLEAKRKEEEQKQKARDEAIAKCKGAEIDGKFVTFTTSNLKDSKYSDIKDACSADRTNAAEDRDARRKAFHEVVDELQEALRDSDSPAERKRILARIKSLKSSIIDTDLKRDIKYLEQGAKDFVQITDLAMDNVYNKNNRLNNAYKIDQIAASYQLSSIPNLSKYSESTQEIIKDNIKDWSEIIIPLGRQAIQSPQQVLSEYFGETAVSTQVNNPQNSQPGNTNGQNPISATTNIRGGQRSSTGMNAIPGASMTNNPNLMNNNMNIPQQNIRGGLQRTGTQFQPTAPTYAAPRTGTYLNGSSMPGVQQPPNYQYTIPR